MKFAKVFSHHISHHRHTVSVQSGGVWQVQPLGRYTPWAGTPPDMYTQLGRYTPLGRYIPMADGQQVGSSQPTTLQSCCTWTGQFLSGCDTNSVGGANHTLPTTKLINMHDTHKALATRWHHLGTCHQDTCHRPLRRVALSRFFSIKLPDHLYISLRFTLINAPVKQIACLKITHNYITVLSFI